MCCTYLQLSQPTEYTTTAVDGPHALFLSRTDHTSSVVARTSKLLEVNWLEKNNDTLDVGWLQKLAHSQNALLGGVYRDDFEASRTKTSKTTVGKRFLGDVRSLLDELSSTRPLFIRCIKPNMEKVPKSFTVSLVLEQLRCSGLMGAVKLMQEAYPTRVPYGAIYEQCEKLVGKEAVRQIKCHPACFCEKVMQTIGKSDKYALGLSKLFLKAGGGAFLYDLAQMDADKLVASIKKKLEASRRMLHTSVRIVACYCRWRRATFARFERAAIRLQHGVRSRVVRRRYATWRLARLARLEEERLQLDAATKRERQEAELRDKVASVRSIEQQILRHQMEQITTEAKQRMQSEVQRARDALLASSAVSGPVELVCRPSGGAPVSCELAHRSLEQRLAAPAAEEAMRESTRKAEARMTSHIQDTEKAKLVQLEASVESARERLEREVLNGAPTDVCQEFVQRLAEATGRSAPPPAPQPKRRVTIVDPGVGGTAQSPSALAAASNATGVDDGSAVEEEATASSAVVAAAASASPPGKADPRARRRTLAGHWTQTDGERFEVVLETAEARDSMGLTLEEWNSEVVVLRLEVGGCAYAEGSLRPGDIITAIDGVAVANTAHAQQMFKGRAGKRGRRADQHDATVTKRAVGAGARTQAAHATTGGGADDDGVYIPPVGDDSEELPHRGCEFFVDVLRRPLTYNLKSEVEVRMPSGEWQRFAAEVRSNRTIFYEELAPPHVRSEVLLDDLIAVAPSLEAEGERVLQVYTRHKVIDMKPQAGEFRSWHLRLQELLLTRVEAVHSGFLHKEKLLDAADAVTSTRIEASEAMSDTPPNRFCRYFFVLYANGILVYFSDPDSAVLGQARGFMPVETAFAHSRAKRKLADGDRVRIVCGKSADLAAVVIRQKASRMRLRYQVQLEEAQTQFDARPTTLCYCPVGAENEPTACVDDRGVATVSFLSLGGGGEAWQLGVDSKSERDAWFTSLLRFKASPSNPTATHAPSDPTFADVLLAQGHLDILNWEHELECSQAEADADQLSSIRAIAANILAMAGIAPPPRASQSGTEYAPSEYELDEDLSGEWSSRWYALRPSGLYLYSCEQRGQEWDAPALEVEMSSVISATAATGVDFFKSIFVLERASGRSLQLRAGSRQEMRQLLGLLQLHCIHGGEQEGCARSRSVAMAGWLFHKASVSGLARTVNALGLHRGRTCDLTTMVLGGALWQMRWLVLDVSTTQRRDPGSARGKARCDARLLSFKSDTTPDSGQPFPLDDVREVALVARRTETGVVVMGNFALRTPRRRWEFAARSEDEAREWVRLLEDTLFGKPSASATESLGAIRV